MQEDPNAAAAAAAPTGPDNTSDPASQADDLVRLREERDDLRDRYMRALADAENARKRAERDRREAEMYGGTRLARDLLDVHDNLRRALDAADDSLRAAAPAFIEGVELTLRDLLAAFSRHAITRISPARGDIFDPQLHQSMFEAPVPGTAAGQIIEVMSEGFAIHDRLLRPARVGVSSMPAAPAAAPGLDTRA